MTWIPYTGAQALARIAARTALARVVLALMLVALALAAAAAARHPKLDRRPLVAPSAGGVLVLDLSASISADTFSRIGQTLTQLAARGGRYGLVVFSGSAYEALPPGTPASALKPIVRYFTLPHQPAPGEQPSYPTNPWTNSFTAGTEISSGLDLARKIELNNHAKHPAVVLISDLADDTNDLNRLTSILQAYKANGIRLTVISLNSEPSDLSRYIGIATRIIPAATQSENPSAARPPHARFPTTLVVLALLVAVLLAANELRSARLRWGGTAEVAT